MAKYVLSRRSFLALSATISASALAACVAPSAPAPAADPAAAPAAGPTPVPAVEPKTVSHWVYSTLPMDRDTLKSVPADQTTNGVNYFDWNLEKIKEVEPNVEMQLEY